MPPTTTYGDGMGDDWSMAEVVRALHRIEKSLTGLDDRFVSRGEYVAHTLLSDERHQGLQDEIRSRRVSWPSVVSAGCAALAAIAVYVK